MTAPETPSPLDLDRLEALAEKATPGPWRRSGPDVDMGGRDRWVICGHSFDRSTNKAETEQDERDAAYLQALSPEVVRALVSRVREAEKQVAAMIRVSESLAEVIRTHAPEAHKQIVRLVQNRAEADRAR